MTVNGHFDFHFNLSVKQSRLSLKLYKTIIIALENARASKKKPQHFDRYVANKVILNAIYCK